MAVAKKKVSMQELSWGAAPSKGTSEQDVLLNLLQTLEPLLLSYVGSMPRGKDKLHGAKLLSKLRGCLEGNIK